MWTNQITLFDIQAMKASIFVLYFKRCGRKSSVLRSQIEFTYEFDMEKIMH
jgi:PBP1b-binding outer membrane lipoprotein LpoB